MLKSQNAPQSCPILERLEDRLRVPHRGGYRGAGDGPMGAGGGVNVTWLIRTHVKPGKEEEYEEWLSGIAKDCSEFGGFQGVTIFRPNDPGHRHPEYVATLRFAGSISVNKRLTEFN